MWEYKGTIQIIPEDDPYNLKMLNPAFTILTVIYDWDNNGVTLQLIFLENGGINKISRNFTFINEGGGEIGLPEIKAFITNDPVLGQSTYTE